MLDSYRELLDLLAQTPTRLREAAERAGEPPEGEWSAAQVLAHMAATEQLWFGRLNAIMHQSNPLLKIPGAEYQQAQDALMDGTVEANLTAFNNVRGESVSLLMGLSLRDWDRTGTHETRGEVSIADVVETMIDHDAEHINQIEALAS
jgi:uncharacterized damage-inducible protein DinB